MTASPSSVGWRFVLACPFRGFPVPCVRRVAFGFSACALVAFVRPSGGVCCRARLRPVLQASGTKSGVLYNSGPLPQITSLRYKTLILYKTGLFVSLPVAVAFLPASPPLAVASARFLAFVRLVVLVVRPSVAFGFSSRSLTGSRSSGGNGNRRRFEVVRFSLAVE